MRRIAKNSLFVEVYDSELVFKATTFGWCCVFRWKPKLEPIWFPNL